MYGNPPPPGGFGAPGSGPGYPPPYAAPNPYGAPNPYAPPAFGPAGYGAMAPFGGPGFGAIPYGTAESVVPAWVGKALLVSSFWWVLFVVMALAIGIFGDADGGPIAAIAMILAMLLVMFHQIGALFWQYRAWAGILPEFRRTQSGKMIAPGEAAGFLIIPYFNLYWMFVISGGIADAANLQAEAYGSPLRVNRSNGTIACIMQLVFPFLAGIFWFRLTREVEACTADARARAASAGRPH